MNCAHSFLISRFNRSTGNTRVNISTHTTYTCVCPFVKNYNYLKHSLDYNMMANAWLTIRTCTNNKQSNTLDKRTENFSEKRFISVFRILGLSIRFYRTVFFVWYNTLRAMVQKTIFSPKPCWKYYKGKRYSVLIDTNLTFFTRTQKYRPKWNRGGFNYRNTYFIVNIHDWHCRSDGYYLLWN